MHFTHSENSKILVGDLVFPHQLISFLNIPEGMRGTHRPGDTMPIYSVPVNTFISSPLYKIVLWPVLTVGI